MLAQSPPRSLISHNSYVTVLTTTAVFAIVFYFQSFAMAAEPADVTFSTAFEGGSLGRIEKVNDTTFRVHVLGQQDERGRNRAATWYCFRMDHVKGRDLTITITDFIGEYNDVIDPERSGVQTFAQLRDHPSEDQILRLGLYIRDIDQLFTQPFC